MKELINNGIQMELANTSSLDTKIVEQERVPNQLIDETVDLSEIDHLPAENNT